jgi:hypothetical protein
MIQQKKKRIFYNKIFLLIEVAKFLIKNEDDGYRKR